MTRSEALDRVMTALRANNLGFDVRAPTVLVDGLEALGLISFDQPKSVEERAIEALESIRSPIKHSDLPAILSAAGLKIVEK